MSPCPKFNFPGVSCFPCALVRLLQGAFLPYKIFKCVTVGVMPSSSQWELGIVASYHLTQNIFTGWNNFCPTTLPCRAIRLPKVQKSLINLSSLSHISSSSLSLSLSYSKLSAGAPTQGADAFSNYLCLATYHCHYHCLYPCHRPSIKTISRGATSPLLPRSPMYSGPPPPTWLRRWPPLFIITDQIDNTIWTN